MWQWLRKKDRKILMVKYIYIKTLNILVHLQDGNNLLEVGKSSGCLASKKGGNCKYMSLKKRTEGLEKKLVKDVS